MLNLKELTLLIPTCIALKEKDMLILFQHTKDQYKLLRRYKND